MTEEKETPIERPETLKVKDFADMVKGITGLVRENYLNGFEFALSIWEENLRVLNTQVEQWHSLQMDYIDVIRGFYERFPKELATLWEENSKAFNRQFDRFVAFQKSYVDLVRNVPDKFTKEALNLAQKNTEMTLSLFDDYFNLFRV
jgi:cyclopropane fatty-acyl-phospholipid synthase-like methyltransferase